jgi:hypothetical protein
MQVARHETVSVGVLNTDVHYEFTRPAFVESDQISRCLLASVRKRHARSFRFLAQLREELRHVLLIVQANCDERERSRTFGATCNGAQRHEEHSERA